MLYSVLQNTYSGDALYLAMRQARRMCPHMSDEEFDELKTGTMQMWEIATDGNPIKGMF